MGADGAGLFPAAFVRSTFALRKGSAPGSVTADQVAAAPAALVETQSASARAAWDAILSHMKRMVKAQARGWSRAHLPVFLTPSAARIRSIYGPPIS